MLRCIGALAILAPVEAQLAEESCPCISTRPATAPDPLIYTYNGTAHTFPVNYGLAACGTWDADVAPQCNRSDSRPLWCSQRWCYVARTCKGDFGWDVEADGGIPDVWFPNSGLNRSYSTCGTASYVSRGDPTSKYRRTRDLSAEKILDEVDDFLWKLRRANQEVQSEVVDGLYKTGKGVNRRCETLVDNCDCTSCGDSAIDAGSVGYSAPNFTKLMYEDFGEGDACAERGRPDQQFRGFGQRMIEGEISGEMHYTWAQRYAGARISFPAKKECPAQRDFRNSAEYVFASTGPKDVVVIVGCAASSFGGISRGKSLVDAFTDIILHTLTDGDYVSVVLLCGMGDIYGAPYYRPKQFTGLFNSSDFDRTGFISESKELAPMVAATAENKADIIQWMTEMLKETGGSFQLRVGIDLAVKVILNSKDARRTSGCQTALIILAPSIDSTNLQKTQYYEVTKSLLPPPLMVYVDWQTDMVAGDKGARTNSPAKMLACHTNINYHYNGIYLIIPGLETNPNFYIKRWHGYFSASAPNISTTRYVTKNVSTEVITACLPTYSTWTILDRHLSGVACVDINLFVSLETLQNERPEEYAKMKQIIQDRNTKCEPVWLSNSLKYAMQDACYYEIPIQYFYYMAAGSSVLFVMCMGSCYCKRKEITKIVREKAKLHMVSKLRGSAVGSRQSTIADSNAVKAQSALGGTHRLEPESTKKPKKKKKKNQGDEVAPQSVGKNADKF